MDLDFLGSCIIWLATSIWKHFKKIVKKKISFRLASTDIEVEMYHLAQNSRLVSRYPVRVSDAVRWKPFLWGDRYPFRKAVFYKNS